MFGSRNFVSSVFANLRGLLSSFMILDLTSSLATVCIIITTTAYIIANMLTLPALRTLSGSAARTPVLARFNSTQAGSGPDASYGSATRSTVPPRSTHATYHPGGYGISEGLKRARKPYRFRNILTGSLIMGFATSVYFYSISKVKQDDFSDLAEVRAPGASSNAGPVTTEADDKHKV
ncbi:uncharacterized protein UBRO2_03666 [Ustilago bromivora]|uniref:Cytochrome c oxidase assembly factor 3 n=2 Tax=Ustilago bromivora TaxID=307758 RepID=A0A8H8QN90_9BASI|nr:uncharacterized protein UBRO2_03666 [Ustilago bromivora]